MQTVFDSQVARGECESASIKRLEQQLKLSIPLVQSADTASTVIPM